MRIIFKVLLLRNLVWKCCGEGHLWDSIFKIHYGSNAAVKFVLEMQLLSNSFVNIVMNTIILEVRLWNPFWKWCCETYLGCAIVKKNLLLNSFWKCCCENHFGTDAVEILQGCYCETYCNYIDIHWKWSLWILFWKCCWEFNYFRVVDVTIF